MAIIHLENGAALSLSTIDVIGNNIDMVGTDLCSKSRIGESSVKTI